jgi:hypothetical protein
MRITNYHKAHKTHILLQTKQRPSRCHGVFYGQVVRRWSSSCGANVSCVGSQLRVCCGRDSCTDLQQQVLGVWSRLVYPTLLILAAAMPWSLWIMSMSSRTTALSQAREKYGSMYCTVQYRDVKEVGMHPQRWNMASDWIIIYAISRLVPKCTYLSKCTVAMH